MVTMLRTPTVKIVVLASEKISEKVKSIEPFQMKETLIQTIILVLWCELLKPNIFNVCSTLTSYVFSVLEKLKASR